MIFYYVAFAQDTANKTVSETFYRCVYACICMRKYFTIFLFTEPVTYIRVTGHFIFQPYTNPIMTV